MQRLRHLVVILPGIGGSVLRGPGSTPTWDSHGTELATTLIRPSGLDLDRFPDLAPTALVHTFSAFGSLLTIAGYEGLEHRLAKNFQDIVAHTYRHGTPIPSGVNVLLFPYDFRRSVRESAQRLADCVRRALDGATPRQRPVIVLAHSMGGLVARYWIGPLAGWRVCAALLTLGTPHRGAPKALDWLLRGPGVGRLRHPGVRRVLRQWPSMYELLPQYPAVWDEVAGHEIELDRLPTAALRDRPSLAKYATQFATMAAAARQVHDDIAAGWSAIPAHEVPAVAPYFGRGHPTPNLATLHADGRLAVSKVDPPWRGNVGWLGDGTVPAISAIPRELADTRAVWRGVAERHGPLANTPAFLDLLRSYSGEALPTRGTTAPLGPWLGIDIDDVVPSDAETPVAVTVQPDGTTALDVHLTLTATGARTALLDKELDGDGRVWHCLLPALPAGRYRLSLEARQVNGPESVFAGTDLVVLDPDDEAEAAESRWVG